MKCRFIYPVYTYDGSEEEGHARKASAEGRINGNGRFRQNKGHEVIEVNRTSAKVSRARSAVSAVIKMELSRAL
jgi:hypothetical protein